MKSLKNLSDKLKIQLQNAYKRNIAEGMLFSGGLDTCILAALGTEIRTINVALGDFSTDLSYAKTMEKFFNLKINYLKITADEAIKAIPEVIRILRSFDPAIPNDITVYFGLKYAKNLGLKSIMTGDGADEFFGGYSYMCQFKDLNLYIRQMRRKMTFNSNLLGDFFGIEIKQPFLDPRVIECALSIDAGLKIRKHTDKLHGKWILRKAFEKMLPEQIVWQSKRPLEFGSGTTALRKIIAEQIMDDEYESKMKKYGIKFINKEHLYFYEVYRQAVGEIPQPKNTEEACFSCGAGILKNSFHCRICGGVKNESLCFLEQR